MFEYNVSYFILEYQQMNFIINDIEIGRLIFTLTNSLILQWILCSNERYGNIVWSIADCLCVYFTWIINNNSLQTLKYHGLVKILAIK